MTNWKEYKLGELGEVITGKTPSSKNPEQWGYDMPFVTPTDFDAYNKNITDSIRYLSKEGVKAFKKKVLPKNSVIVTCIGSQMGKVAINKKECVTNQQINSIVPSQEFNSDFIYYVLSSMQDYLRNLATGGSTMPIVNKTSFEEITISIPDLPTQTAIAEILSSLDDKIELNNKINQELENLAQTLFKQWFIDFEFPTENGEPYKSSGGEMVDSELGEIPQGWKVGTFGDLCKVVNGYAFKSKDFQETGNNGILKIRNVNGSIVDIINTQFVASDVVKSVQEKFRVLSGHILIAMTGAEVGKIGIVPETNKNLWLNQRVGRFEPVLGNSIVFIFHLFNVLNFTQAVRNSAMGSAQPNISASGIEGLHCIIPDKNVILKYSSINQDAYILTLKHLGENQELTNLRDTLLPKLISGELEVAEVMAEKA